VASVFRVKEETEQENSLKVGDEDGDIKHLRFSQL
jgi:hypothetical protein